MTGKCRDHSLRMGLFFHILKERNLKSFILKDLKDEWIAHGYDWRDLTGILMYLENKDIMYHEKTQPNNVNRYYINQINDFYKYTIEKDILLYESTQGNINE